MAVKPSVPPRRPGQQNDPALHEAVRAHWREVVRRLRPVDNTARLHPDVHNTARLDPETVAVRLSVPPRRPGQQNDAAPHEAVRAHWGEVVRRARPVDNTARLDLGVDTSARTDVGVDTTARTDVGVVDTAQTDVGVVDTAQTDVGVVDTAQTDVGVDTTARTDRGTPTTSRVWVLTTLRD